MKPVAFALLVSASAALANDGGVWSGTPVSSGNLLAGRVPMRAEKVSDPGRMTDGLAAPDGDEWKSTRTSIIEVGGLVEWDLGEVKPIRAGLLQGDNNDDYLLEGSVDGREYLPLWRVHAMPANPGLQTRTNRAIVGMQARYVRLTARGGDSMYSVSELELHATPESLSDGALKRQRGRASDDLPSGLWLATIAAVVVVVQSKQRVLWVLAAPLLAALVWASVTAVLDRFVAS